MCSVDEEKVPVRNEPSTLDSPGRPVAPTAEFPAWIQQMPTAEVINLCKGGSTLAFAYVAFCGARHQEKYLADRKVFSTKPSMNDVDLAEKSSS